MRNHVYMYMHNLCQRNSGQKSYITEEMAEAYRRCQARRGRSGGGSTLPGVGGYNNQRRRSRAVLYHLSGQFEKHNRANRAKTKLQQLNKVSCLNIFNLNEKQLNEIKKQRNNGAFLACIHALMTEGVRTFFFLKKVIKVINSV